MKNRLLTSEQDRELIKAIDALIAEGISVRNVLTDSLGLEVHRTEVITHAKAIVKEPRIRVNSTKGQKKVFKFSDSWAHAWLHSHGYGNKRHTQPQNKKVSIVCGSYSLRR